MPHLHVSLYIRRSLVLHVLHAPLCLGYVPPVRSEEMQDLRAHHLRFTFILRHFRFQFGIRLPDVSSRRLLFGINGLSYVCMWCLQHKGRRHHLFFRFISCLAKPLQHVLVRLVEAFCNVSHLIVSSFLRQQRPVLMFLNQIKYFRALFSAP